MEKDYHIKKIQKKIQKHHKQLLYQKIKHYFVFKITKTTKI